VRFRQGALLLDSIIPRAGFEHEHEDSDSTEPPKSCPTKLLHAIFQTEDLLDQNLVSETSAGDFRVVLTLKPHIPVTKRLMVRSETALGQKIRRLSILRSGTNGRMVRFALKPVDQEDADPLQEGPTRRSTWQVT